MFQVPLDLSAHGDLRSDHKNTEMPGDPEHSGRGELSGAYQRPDRLGKTNPASQQIIRRLSEILGLKPRLLKAAFALV